MCYTKGAAGGLSVIPPLVPYLTNHQKESSRMVPPGGNIIESRPGVQAARPTEKNRQRAEAHCLFSFSFFPFPVFSISGIFPQLFAPVRELCYNEARAADRTALYISSFLRCGTAYRHCAAQKRKESFPCQQQQNRAAQERPPSQRKATPPRARAGLRTSPTSSSTATPRNPTIR